MQMTEAEVNALALRARALLDALNTCASLPAALQGPANALSDALHPFEVIEPIDPRLIYVDGPPRCMECARSNIKLAKWRKGNAVMCDEHKAWLERVDALPSVCEVIRRKPTPKPWQAIAEQVSETQNAA